jgi:hypothetical protein
LRRSLVALKVFDIRTQDLNPSIKPRPCDRDVQPMPWYGSIRSSN